MTEIIISALAGLFIGLLAGFRIKSALEKKALASDRRNYTAKRGEAEKAAELIVKNAEMRTKIELLKAKEDFEKSTKEKRREIAEQGNILSKREQILLQREGNLDHKADMLETKEQNLDKRIEETERLRESLKIKVAEAETKTSEADSRLVKLASKTREEARKELMELTSSELQVELGTMIRRMKEDAEKNSEKISRGIILNAMQRYAASQASESSTKSISIKSDDVKGKIIGREGRNIRALEAATGVTVLIDDTPDAIVISSFDPIRREIASMVIEKLLASGRINPVRIEETAADVEESFNNTINQIGADACSHCNVSASDTEILNAVGKMKYRTSFSQNVLDHSMEVAFIAGIIAPQIGLEPDIARKAGLFHDIGKVLDHMYNGPHALAGADFLRKYSENQDVVNAVAGHHSETDVVTDYAALISVADAISSSRPGARSESAGIYLQRIENIEKIARKSKNVKKAFALQSGRELRVIVDPDETSDSDASVLARDIANRIQSEIQFPGQIRVTVIRERRCTEFAR